MTKILNILSGIKINKDNVESPYTKVRKSSETSTSVTFTLSTDSPTVSGTAIILIDHNTRAELALVTVHGTQIYFKMVTGDSVLSSSENSITVKTDNWSFVTLIDFEGNDWS